MTRFASKFAASSMVIAIAIVGCQADSIMTTAVAASAERSEQQASRLAEQARAAAQRGDNAAALRLAERAVELAPRDAGYRMLLADLYLRNGRFRSAETSYSDVIEIDGGNVRAGLSIALAQIAQGATADALATLEAIEGAAPASDVGLAYALAGQPQRAVALLEPAARAADATGRTRQNLALAYALSGDWTRARAVAAQDVSPAELGGRLQHWASLSSPSGQRTAVATLLGVTPAASDPGQPVRLALAPAAPASTALAEAAPEQAAAPDAEAPVQYAAAEIPVPVAEAAPEPAPETIRYAEDPVLVAPAEAPEPVRYAAAEVPSAAPATAPAAAQSGSWWPREGAAPAAAVQVAQPAEASAPAVAEAPVILAAAEPARAAPVAAPVRTASADEAPAPAAVSAVLTSRSPLLSRSLAPARASRPVFAPAKAAVRSASISARLPRAGSGTGNYVVQLGAFANPNNAERAWNEAQRRYGVAASQARTAQVTIGGRTLTRVSIAGFDTRSQAVSLCSSIQAQGGSCFVRGVAGDTNVRWASSPARGGRG
jgi:Flp pilus assembly protein TadD